MNGDVSQKEYLLFAITLYTYETLSTHFHLVYNIIKHSIELIERNKCSYHNSLFQAVTHISTLVSQYNTIEQSKVDEMFEMVLIHMMKMIMNNNTQPIQNEYITGLNMLMSTELTLHNISHDVIEYVIDLGKFGQNITNRKFSCYFCSMLLRLLKHINTHVIKRLLLLGEVVENTIRYEMSYQLRYIIYKDHKEGGTYRKQLFDIIERFCKDNDDIITKCILCESILINIDILTCTEIETTAVYVNEVFAHVTKGFVYKEKTPLLTTLIDKCYDSYVHDKKMLPLLKGVQTFIAYERGEKYWCELICSCLYEIVYCLHKQSECDEVIESVFKWIYNDLFEREWMWEEDKRIDALRMFYPVIGTTCAIIPHVIMISDNVKRMFLFVDIGNVVYEDTIDNKQRNKVKFVIDKRCKEFEIQMNNIDKIFTQLLTSKADVNGNELIKEFVDLFYNNNNNNNFNHLIYFMQKLYTPNTNYNMYVKLFTAISITIPYLYVNVPSKSYEHTYMNIYSHMKQFLNTDISFVIVSHAMNVIALLVKYSFHLRNEIVAYMDTTFMRSDSFYKRRIYIVFISKCKMNMSQRFVSEKVKNVNENYKLMKECDSDIVKEGLKRVCEWKEEDQEEVAIKEREVKEESEDCKKKGKQRSKKKSSLNVGIPVMNGNMNLKKNGVVHRKSAANEELGSVALTSGNIGERNYKIKKKRVSDSNLIKTHTIGSNSIIDKK